MELDFYDEKGQRFCLKEVRDAFLAIHDIETRQVKLARQIKIKEELLEYSIRKEPLGYDRDLRAYYLMEGDDRIYIEELVNKDTGELYGQILKKRFTELMRIKLKQDENRRLAMETAEVNAIRRKVKEIMDATNAPLIAAYEKDKAAADVEKKKADDLAFEKAVAANEKKI